MPNARQQTSEVELLASISERLGSLLVVTALAYAAGKQQTAVIESFAKAGLSAKAICDATGWASTTVAPIVSKAKTKKAK